MLSPFDNTSMGKPIKSKALKNILNVFSGLREENSEDSNKQSTVKAAEFAVVSLRTVFRLKRKKEGIWCI